MRRKSALRGRATFLVFCSMIGCIIVVIYINFAGHSSSNGDISSPPSKISTVIDVTDASSTSSTSSSLSNSEGISTSTSQIVVPVKSSSTGSGGGKKKIAYAITVTKDGPFVDGALVLGWAAKKVHDANSKYDADLVAFVVPSVVTSRAILSKFGWRIIERQLPVALDEIVNVNYANAMKNSGCCGADEFLKLWAYTLTEYHRVVHLDMDSIVFKNMDDLYELDKEMLFTGDYGMMGGSPVPPAQGGFLVVRPSMETFEEFRAIIRKGDHTGGGGWGGSHIGNFWGGQTIQGIVPYFYHSIHPDRGLEVNRCIYNCMVDNPYRPYKDENAPKVCLDKKPTCEDCRLQKFEDVASAHFTICQKPWTCTKHTNPRNAKLCEAFHDHWFALRDELERAGGMDLSYRVALDKTRHKRSMGMCKGYDQAHHYLPIPIDTLQKMPYPQ